MLIRSLCHFAATRGKRRSRATSEVENLFQGQKVALRWTCAAAIVMQLSPLLIPFTLRAFLPSILGNTKGVISDLLNAESGVRQISREQMGLLWSLCIVVTVIGLVRATSTYLFLRWGSECGHRFVAAFRTVAYAHLLRLPVRYFEKHGSGRILLRFVGDTDALRNWVSRSGPRLAADVLVAVLLIAAMLSISVSLTLMMFIPLTVMAVAVAYFADKVRAETRESRRRQSVLTGHLAMRLNAIRTTKLLDAQGRSRDPAWPMIEHVATTNASRDRFSSLLESVGQFLTFSAIPMVLLLGIRQAWLGRLPPTDLMTFVWLTLHLIAIAKSALPAIVIQQKALISVQRLHALLSRSAEKGRGRRAIRSWLWGLEFEYRTAEEGSRADGSKAELLQRTFSCSGPGAYELPEKVSAEELFASLAGFQRWEHGLLKLGGVDIQSTDITRRRRKILQLRTSPLLIDGTLAENLFVLQSKQSEQKEHCQADKTIRMSEPLRTDVLSLANCNGISEQQLIALGDLRLPKRWQFTADDLQARISHNGGGLSNDQLRAIAVCQTLLARPQILLIPQATQQDWPVRDLEFVIERTTKRTIVLQEALRRPEMNATTGRQKTYAPPAFAS